MTKKPRPETVIKVDDRSWKSMLHGVKVERWPGDVPPAVGQRVVVFDREYEFTQHDVVKVKGMSVTIGPAIPWEDKRAEYLRQTSL